MIARLLRHAVPGAALASSACMTAPASPPAALSASAAGPFASVPAATIEAVPDDWWRLYDDARLDALVTASLEANADLRVAYANLDGARAALRQTQAVRLPTATIESALAVDNPSGQASAASVPASDWDIAATASWDIDLFGRLRSAALAARADVEAQQAAHDAVKVAVVADTVLAFLELCGATRALVEAKSVAASQARSVAIVREQFAAGEVSPLEVSQAATLAANARAQVPPFEAQRANALYRLATLQGKTPAEARGFDLSCSDMPRLRAAAPVGEGTALLLRRPDVREAERRLAAAAARVGVARADLYPRVNLGGALGLLAGGFAAVASPLVTWAFPNQGPARAKLAQARASEQAALAGWDVAVLRALREVETNLAAYDAELHRNRDHPSQPPAFEVERRVCRGRDRDGARSGLHDPRRMMSRRFWGSTAGLVGLAAIVLGLVTVAIGGIAYEVTHEALEAQLDHRIAAETAALVAEAQGGGLPAFAAAIRRREAARSMGHLEYLLVDRNGARIAGDMTAQVPSKMGFEEFLHFRRPADGPERIAQSLTTRVQGGTLVVAADRSDLDQIDQTLFSLFSAALAGVLVVGVGFAALIGFVTRRRLKQIDATAHAIIEGDLSRRVPRDGSGNEFDSLAGTLNQMLDRISGLMDNLRQVSSDVAHDLRTPLMRLYAALDQAADAEDPIVRASEIRSAREQAAELLELFSALLRITEIEGLSESLPRQAVDLSTLLSQLAESYRPDVEDAGHQLRCSISPEVIVEGDRRLLSQAVANLLDNGIRHTPSGTTISVELDKDDRGCVLTISDDGPGVAAVERERLFERFARSERSRSTPGHGLGLALVRAIVAAHGGHVSLNAAEGFRLSIRLPVKSVD